jgi:hypothetical protein
VAKITHNIDWLQYSVAWPDFVWQWPIEYKEATDIVRTAIPHLHVKGEPYSRPEGQHVGGMQGYTRTYDFGYASGHVDPNRRDMKIGVRMAGQDLGVWRDLGGDDRRLVGFVKGAKASTSRVDIAFDLFDYGINVPRIYDDWKAGKVEARCRKAKPYTEGEMQPNGKVTEATTVYFGSRTSEVMVRFYEKGKERGVDLDWTRVELEIKGDKAKVVMEDCARLGIDTVGKQMLREFFPKMPYKFWKQLLTGESVALTSVGRKMTEREAWIRNVVLPVLREEIANEWDSMTETGITREIEALIRQNWTTRATAIRKQYGLL